MPEEHQQQVMINAESYFILLNTFLSFYLIIHRAFIAIFF